MSVQDSDTPRERGFLGWRMVTIAFLAQNSALGLSYGVYGTMVLPFAREFDAPRALASSGLSLVMVIGGLLSPLLALAIERWSIRTVMSMGVLAMFSGYLAIAVAPTMVTLLIAYGLLVGLGVMLLGFLPSSTLVTRWFASNRGFAMGISSMPVFIALMPLVATTLVANYGWRITAVAIGLSLLLLLPVLQLIVDHPTDVEQVAFGSVTTNAASPATQDLPLRVAQFLRDRRFWLIGIGSGFSVAGASMLVTHLIPMVMDAAIPQGQAALILSVLGASGILGTVVFGRLGDRIGYVYALVLNGLLQALLWSGLIVMQGFATYLALVAAIGICSGGRSPITAALVSQIFGHESYARIMGLLSMTTLPFLLTAAPFAGFLFDRTGSYAFAVIVQMVAFVLSALAYLAANCVSGNKSSCDA